MNTYAMLFLNAFTPLLPIRIFLFPPISLIFVILRVCAICPFIGILNVSLIVFRFHNFLLSIHVGIIE